MTRGEPWVALLADTAVGMRAYGRIGTALRAVAGINLLDYKRSVVLRRVQRRMQRTGLTSMDDYAEHLGRDRDEALALARDMLVPNTAFFRDPELYSALVSCLPQLLVESSKPQIWVPACAGGEEVYSIAMLVAEALAAREAPAEFLVFGSDIDAGALAEARAARFTPEAAERVPSQLRARYLEHRGDEIRARRSLTAHCVFMVHDALAPSPLLDLDLISCRNLLAFLEVPAQRRVLEHFRAALRPGGLLLVGRNESVGSYPDLFARSCAGPGLYRRVEPPRGVAPAAPASTTSEEGAYRAAFDSATMATAVLDVSGRVLEVNAALLELCARPAVQLIGRPLSALFVEADGAAVERALAQAQDTLDWTDTALRLRTAEAAELPLHLRLRRTAVDPSLYVVAEFDAEAAVALRLERPRSRSLLDVGLRLTGESVIVTDTHGVITEVNASAERLTGWSRREALGQPHDRVVRLVSPTGAPEPSPLWACLRDQAVESTGQRNHKLIARDGRRLTVRLSCAPLMNEHALSGAALLLQDTTEQSLLAEELEYRSTHDPVTGLLNRDEFERRLSGALTDAHTRSIEHLLCYVDLDQFKVINDTLGHYAGDELLRQVAAIFRARLRPQDVLARLGGDEFGVLLEEVGAGQGRPLVESLLEAARSFRFHWEAQSYSITVSIGVAPVNRGCENTAHALSDADAACFAAKDGGRDRARWADEGATEIQRRHGEMSLVNKIGKALDDNQFVLFYEDVVQTRALSEVMYRELLVRMRDDQGRLVRPGSFIAAAERYYLMTALDRWVVNAAFKGIARLPSDAVTYAVNVSGMSLSDDKFLSYVIGCIERTGVAPERLCLEITETAAISHLSEAVRFIESLADLGCRFALDDFGAGMASFSYLKNLPVQYLKIDGSFVRSMQESHVDRGMVEAINRIGHEMGLRTIAEHVEDASVLATLEAIGVDWVQGSAISPGRPFSDLLATQC